MKDDKLGLCVETHTDPAYTNTVAHDPRGESVLCLLRVKKEELAAVTLFSRRQPEIIVSCIFAFFFFSHSPYFSNHRKAEVYMNNL